MNESEQEQAISEVKEWLEKQLREVQSRGDYSAWPSEDSANCIIELLEFVDSQAQKIAEQAKKIERLESDLRVMNEVISYNPMIMEK